MSETDPRPDTPTSSDSDRDATIAVTMAWEIRRKAAPMEIVFQPLSIFQLVGLIQLALRHPDLSDELLAIGAAFVDAAREYFADCPTVLDVIHRGQDPREDRPLTMRR